MYFPPPHTGTLIGQHVKRVLKEWNLQVPIIVTDNGSNMIKAFKAVKSNAVIQDEIFETINEVPRNGELENSEELVFSDEEVSDDGTEYKDLDLYGLEVPEWAQTDGGTEDTTSMDAATQSVPRVSEYQDGGNQSTHLVVEVPHSSPAANALQPTQEGIDSRNEVIEKQMSLEDMDVLLRAQELEIEADEYDYASEETDVFIALYEYETSASRQRLLLPTEPRTFQLRRIGCVSHTLQLVMAQFDKFRLQKSRYQNQGAEGQPQPVPPFITMISKARKLVAKFNSSTIATPRLQELCKQKLVGDVTTRWSSTYLLLHRLLKLRKSVSDVCVELEWDNLSNSEWKLLEVVDNLLEPFASYTQLVSGDSFVTFSAIVPCIEEIRLHLERVSKVQFNDRN